MFGVIIAVARKTRSGEISSWGGLFSYAPGLGALATIFLASLAGIPPLGGWVGKFAAFQSMLTSGSGWGYSLALIGAVNSVVAFGYYGSVMREIWMKPVPDGDIAQLTSAFGG
jgi:NADH-quinone oxidoreductase subunit N